MGKNLLLAVCALASVSVQAQKTADPQPFAKTITTTDLKKHLSIIAGAEMEGRDTPSPGLEKAATYIETQFKSFGVKPGNKDSYRQFFDLEKDSASTLSLNMGGIDFNAWSDLRPGCKCHSR